ncbi:MAG: N-acetylglucosamine-6-phosphate deacetylase [Deltaproteobacteria bacterium]|nr:N-acetylglucosamine-6-phosphate deacetylase [Deltaproteobacteria bacterium]
MARWAIEGATLLDPEGLASGVKTLLLDGHRIEALLEPGAHRDLDAERYDATGLRLAPWFIDLHFHGELLFAPPEDFASALERASRQQAGHGTTSFLATSVAWGPERLLDYVTRLVDAMTRASAPGAQPLGLHLEGPWINPAAAGAQPVAAIRPYRPQDGELLIACGDILKMVTLAPEVEGAEMLIEALCRSGVIAALGHSCVTSEAAEDAFRRGMTHVTHLFNAMSGLHHRSPGLPGAVLGGREPVSCDLICDGVHVAPDLVRVAARCLGEQLSLITDRIDLPTGEQDGTDFGSGGLVDDGVAWRLAADGRLAGSRLSLDRALRNVQQFGAMTETEAIASVTLRPARLLGLEHEIGVLRPGSRADLVLLDAQGVVVETYVEGRRVFAAPGQSDCPASARAPISA